jgi:hypothetical protein
LLFKVVLPKLIGKQVFWKRFDEYTRLMPYKVLVRIFGDYDCAIKQFLSMQWPCSPRKPCEPEMLMDFVQTGCPEILLKACAQVIHGIEGGSPLRNVDR